MTVVYEDKWPLFEKLLGYFRYFTVRKYIVGKRKLVCADIGCGFDGRFLFHISKKIKKGYGFDIRANPLVRGNIEIGLIQNRGGIPLGNDKVDRIFSLAVLEHVDDGSFFISECIRILKSGGKIIITTPTPMAKAVLEFLSFRLGLISRESIEEHKHYWSEGELRELMLSHGCTCEKYKRFQFGMNQLIVGRKNDVLKEDFSDWRIIKNAVDGS